jgi:class 3 adenylate cyclase
MTRLLQALYRRLGPRYPQVAVAAVLPMSAIVAFAGLWLLTLYQSMSTAEFWTIVLVGEALVLIELAIAGPYAMKLAKPARAWLAGARNPATAQEAWRALVGLPIAFVSYRRPLAVVMNIVPISLFITLYLDLTWYSLAILLAGATVVLLLGVFLRFFALEQALRPVLADLSLSVPGGIVADGAPVVTLRWRLLLALPAINVITGVTVAALSTGEGTRLSDLGADVLVAVAVAFTLSLELTILLSRSILGPLSDLSRATERVTRGDLRVRVPVVSADETGVMSGLFNQMVAGLQERERLHDAFGSYVDPELADRVLAEGTVLAGEEVEVTVLFLDIRDFTGFAERSPPHEVVARLNELFDVVVPVLERHGGHVDKFIGDGLLAVFGAPEPLPGHAEWGVAAAREISSVVRERFAGELAIGVGVNSGPVVAGTIGGGGRLEFTVIGDVVNTAARVERVTRQTGDEVLITDATRLLLDDPPGVLPRGSVELPGKRERVQVHALVDLPRLAPRAVGPLDGTDAATQRRAG